MMITPKNMYTLIKPSNLNSFNKKYITLCPIKSQLIYFPLSILSWLLVGKSAVGSLSPGEPLGPFMLI